jgi:hypothetical protein
LITQKVSEKVEKKNNGGAGRLVKALLQAAVALTETADKRSWRTLPDQILMARCLPRARPADGRGEDRRAAGVEDGMNSDHTKIEPLTP